MPNILNDFTKLNPPAQTAIPKNTFRPEIITGIIVGRGDSLVFSAVDLASTDAFITKLQTGMLADPENRLFPIHGIKNATNDSEKTVIATFGYGDKVKVRDGKPSYSFEMYEGSYQLFQELRKLNDASMLIAFLDQRGTVILTSPDGVTANGFTPSVMDFNGYSFKDGSNPDKYFLTVGITEPGEFYDRMAAVGTGLSLKDILKGILPVRFTYGAGTSTLSVLYMMLKSGDVNFGKLFHTELSDDALFSLTKQSDGAAQALTSVAVNSTTGLATITITAPLTADTNYVLELVGPADLEAADIGTVECGFESIPYIINIPS